MRNKNAKVSNPNDFTTDPGSEERIIYDAKIRPDGSIEVVPSGKENIQDKIEAQRESCDMSYILKQIALGNGEVLQLQPGEYGDFTKAPKTMAEALQMQIDANRAWYDMPIDIRSKFDNDIVKWLVTAGTQEWNKKMFPDQYGANGSKDNGSDALVASEEVS